MNVARAGQLVPDGGDEENPTEEGHRRAYSPSVTGPDRLRNGNRVSLDQRSSTADHFTPAGDSIHPVHRRRTDLATKGREQPHAQKQIVGRSVAEQASFPFPGGIEPRAKARAETALESHGEAKPFSTLSLFSNQRQEILRRSPSRASTDLGSWSPSRRTRGAGTGHEPSSTIPTFLY